MTRFSGVFFAAIAALTIASIAITGAPETSATEQDVDAKHVAVHGTLTNESADLVAGQRSVLSEVPFDQLVTNDLVMEDRVNMLLEMSTEEALAHIQAWNNFAERPATDIGSDVVLNVDIDQLVHANRGVESPEAFDGETFQRRPKPQYPMWNGEIWKEDEPWSLRDLEDMEMPKDEDVRAIIFENVEWMLEQQLEDGQWDVELKGAILDATADDAVDAIIATSLTGLSLRKFYHAAPERIGPALERAATFVMNRVLRGRLPTKVFYACWRYELGLRFLMEEYKHLSKDREERRDLMKTVARRMIQSLFNMQKISGEKMRLSRPRNARKGKGKDLMPASSGLILELPTQENYLDGAKILGFQDGTPAAAAAKEGELKVGDVIVRTEGLRVVNAYDFYSIEEGFTEEQEVKVTVMREGEEGGQDRKRVELDLPRYWPGSLGVTYEADTEGGIRVTGFTRGSQARDSLPVGARVYKIERTDINSVEDFEKLDGTLEVGDDVKVFYEYKGDREREKVETTPKAQAEMGFRVNDEVKSEENGVEVTRIGERYPVFEAGLEPEDFITHVNGLPILGYDHFQAVISRLHAGQDVTLTYLRGYDDATDMTFQPSALVELGDLGFKVILDARLRQLGPVVQITEVREDGPADKAGLKKDDRIVAVDDERAFGHIQNFYFFMMRMVVKGNEYTLTIERDESEQDIKIVAGEPFVSLSEGGWNYYDKEYATSFTTAAILITFLKIEDVFGIKIDRDFFKYAAGCITGMRETDHFGEGTWVYDQRDTSENTKEGLQRWRDHRGNMGRLLSCAYALCMAYDEVGRELSITPKDLRKNIDLFMSKRGELDIVRRFPHTHNYDHYANAAYYWFYAHYFGLMAAKEVKDKDAIEIMYKATIKKNKDVPGVQWLGHEGFGKLVGTAQALLTVAEYTEYDGWDEGDWAKYREGSVTKGGGDDE